jgi:hypothetical protein
LEGERFLINDVGEHLLYVLQLAVAVAGRGNFSKTWGKKLDLSLPLMAQ